MPKNNPKMTPAKVVKVIMAEVAKSAAKKGIDKAANYLTGTGKTKRRSKIRSSIPGKFGGRMVSHHIGNKVPAFLKAVSKKKFYVMAGDNCANAANTTGWYVLGDGPSGDHIGIGSTRVLEQIYNTERNIEAIGAGSIVSVNSAFDKIFIEKEWYTYRIKSSQIFPQHLELYEVQCKSQVPTTSNLEDYLGPGWASYNHPNTTALVVPNNRNMTIGATLTDNPKFTHHFKILRRVFKTLQPAEEWHYTVRRKTHAFKDFKFLESTAATAHLGERFVILACTGGVGHDTVVTDRKGTSSTNLDVFINGVVTYRIYKTLDRPTVFQLSQSTLATNVEGLVDTTWAIEQEEAQ